MNEIFYLGYDLEKAGYNFSLCPEKNEENVRLLHGIASDFAKASKARARLDEEELKDRLVHFAGSINNLLPIVVLSVSHQGVLKEENINRGSTVFKQLFGGNT